MKILHFIKCQKYKGGKEITDGSHHNPKQLTDFSTNFE
jgi:hypothetical protein